MVDVPVPEAGLVIRYLFLWRGEAEDERDQGSKARPCAIVLVMQREEQRTVVTVVPITHTAPDPNMLAVELPALVKARLGLDEDRSWILTHELNTFDWPGPDVDIIDPNSETRRIAYGHLPRGLFSKVVDAVRANLKNGRARALKRTE